MAKKATIDLDTINIKLADGKKSKAGKPEQMEIDGPMVERIVNGKKAKVNAVDTCIELSQLIESTQVELDNIEKVIKDEAKDSKDEAEMNNEFVKTINVKGTAFKLQVQFRDAYSKMDAAMEVPLKNVFGDKYEIMFAKQEVVSLKDGKLEALKTLLGNQFDSFFDTDVSIKPTKEFQYNYFLLRKGLKPDQKAVVQKVLDATQSSPAVKYPK